MKKTRVWMTVIGVCLLIEIILCSVLLLDRGSLPFRMMERLSESDDWITAELIHNLFVKLCLLWPGVICSILILRKKEQRIHYWYYAAIIIALLVLRGVMYASAVKQFVWIPR